MSRPVDEATTAALLEATMRLLSSEGYERTTVLRVAREAHSSKAAVYRRWPDKPSLVAAAIGSALRTANPIAPFTSHPLRDLRSILHGLARTLEHTSFGGAMRAVVGAASLDPRLQELLAELERERRGFLTETLRRCGIAEAKIEVVGELLLGGLYLQVLVRRRPLTPEFVDAICAQLVPE